MLLKEFLTFEEVGEYLVQHGFSYDKQVEEDYHKLKTVILDLYNEKKINPVFHYSGGSEVSIIDAYENNDEDEDEDENEDENEDGEAFVSSTHYAAENGYFFIHDRQFYKVVNKEEIPISENMFLQNYVRFKKHPIYNIDEEEEITLKTVVLRKPSDKKMLDMDSLRYPKIDLDKLFRPKTQLSSVKTNDKNDLGTVVSERDKLGEHQKLLITYALFTPRQIACLLTNYNPAYNHNDDFYNARLDMVDNAVQVNTLIPINDEEQIVARQVKEWLAKHNFIFKGFNDNPQNDSDKLVIDYQRRIAELEQEVEDAKNTGSFQMGNPTVEHDEPKAIEQLRRALTAANAKIADLDSQLTQAKAELVETPTHNQKVEKQGDSLLILGAVMHCIKEAAKKNFTQDLLTQTILDRYKNVSGLSKSTLDKKYSEAKSYLEQRYMP